MSKLFSLTLEELRDRFVVGRYWEKQFFDHRDIEGWLRDEASANRPDAQRWDKLFRNPIINRGFTPEETVTVLGLGGFRFSDCSQALIESRGNTRWKNLQTLMDELTRHGSSVYLSLCGDPIALIKREGAVYVYNLHASYSQITTADVYGPLLLSWREAEWHHEAGVARATTVRTALIKLLESILGKVRAEAEADFNGAVAVSADGNKIVKADRVYIWNQAGSIWEEPVKSFFQDKILLKPNRYIKPEPVEPAAYCANIDDAHGLARRWLTMGRTQTLLWMGNQQVFVTVSDNVPDEFRTPGTLI